MKQNDFKQKHSKNHMSKTGSWSNKKLKKGEQKAVIEKGQEKNSIKWLL